MPQSEDVIRMEALVADVFSTVFPDSDITSQSDFFDLGGDSGAALEIVLHLEERLGRPIHPATLLHHPVVAELASALAAEEAETPAK